MCSMMQVGAGKCRLEAVREGPLGRCIWRSGRLVRYVPGGGKVADSFWVVHPIEWLCTRLNGRAQHDHCVDLVIRESKPVLSVT